MEVEKIRNLSDEELALEGRKAAEQLFRLRFQMKLGQTEGAKKLRELKKDIARINTIGRERELGIHTLVAPKHHAHTEGEAEGSAAAKHARKKAAKPAKKKAAKKSATGHKASGRSAAARKSSAKPSANKKRAARSSSVKKG